MSNKTSSKKQPIADPILDLINSLNSNLRIKKMKFKYLSNYTLYGSYTP